MSAKTKPAKKKIFQSEQLAGVLFSAPALVLLALFVVVPFILAFVLSFQNIRLDSGRPGTWMGFEQYRRILFDPEQSPIFYRSLLNNFTFAAIVVPVQTGLAVLLAVMLNAKIKGIAFFRAFYFMPVVFPMSLVTVIWSLMYSRDSLGLINAFLSWISFGLIGPTDWLGNPAIALISIAILSIWAGVGFQMVIILAGLKEIPLELYEAATIDKASKLQQFWHITVPGLRNTLSFVIIITTIFSLRLFDQVYILTGGGPLDSTSTVMFQAVSSAFKQDNIGRGAAETVIFVLIIVAVTIVQRIFIRQEREVK